MKGSYKHYSLTDFFPAIREKLQEMKRAEIFTVLEDNHTRTNKPSQNIRVEKLDSFQQELKSRQDLEQEMNFKFSVEAHRYIKNWGFPRICWGNLVIDLEQIPQPFED